MTTENFTTPQLIVFIFLLYLVISFIMFHFSDGYNPPLKWKGFLVIPFLVFVLALPVMVVFGLIFIAKLF